MNLRLAACVFAMTVSPALAGVKSLDDIRYWVGTGSQRAALALDWDGASANDAALVWGYRWDGSQTAEAMLRAVFAADARLFAKIGSNQLGVALLGAGYDLDDDGAFAIDDDTVFDAEGVASVSFSDADGAASVDPDDLYREGWQNGYWHYGVGLGAPPVWGSAGLGPTATPLVDGSWHGFAFAVTLNGNEFPQNLLAALPPLMAPDFNADGHVDAADYTVWRDAGGSATQYTAWELAYGTTTSLAIPEPSAFALITLTLLSFHNLTPRDS